MLAPVACSLDALLAEPEELAAPLMEALTKYGVQVFPDEASYSALLARLGSPEAGRDGFAGKTLGMVIDHLEFVLVDDERPGAFAVGEPESPCVVIVKEDDPDT